MCDMGMWMRMRMESERESKELGKSILGNQVSVWLITMQIKPYTEAFGNELSSKYTRVACRLLSEVCSKT